MAKVITLGLQKGGVSKSTTTGVLSWLLSRDGYKVLAIDMDSQGNLTELLTRVESKKFKGKSIYEAIVDKNPLDYIVKFDDNLDVLPSNNFLALLPTWLHTSKKYDLLTDEQYTVPYSGTTTEQLDVMLRPLQDQYDYILIDTPPSLSEQTTNALVASDYVIIMYECSQFCYSAIPNFIETIEDSREVSKHDVEIIGILRTLNDRRRSDSKIFNTLIEEEYPNEVFETIITRKASTGRLPFFGFKDSPELDDAVSQFKEFYEELKVRLGGKQNGIN